MDNSVDKKKVAITDETRIVMGFDEVEVSGEPIKVNEFTFPQELKALTIAAPIIGEIADLYLNGGDPDMLEIEGVFATHGKALTELLSISTGKPVEWFDTLPGKYASSLFLTFWGMNSHFFTQRIASRYIMANPELLKTKKEKLDSANSAQH